MHLAGKLRVEAANPVSQVPAFGWVSWWTLGMGLPELRC